MKHGEQVTVYHTISDGATATVTEGFVQELDQLGITIKQRANGSATLWEDTFIPMGRLSKVVGPEHNNRSY
jgi:hypothetical protein